MNRKSPVRVVIDTNVWLSGLIFGGKPSNIIELFVDETIIVIVCEELLSELRRKIIERFPLYIPSLDLLEASIRKDAEMIKLGSQTINLSRDTDDNKFIETAVIGECQFIISGDKDLLDIVGYKDIKIVTPVAFLNLFLYN
jgi:putative PIN family toxin of toxin-antitoxin system